jgi:predicted SAM-dependent methyltransferase
MPSVKLFLTKSGETLKRWYSILKPNGILRIAVPDFEKVAEHYLSFRDLKVLRGFLWGGQDHDYNFHYVGWDFDTLKSDLVEVGFTNIYRYDWRRTEHSDLDDYSQTYLPHMDKENGMLMSLNVEAEK